MPSHINYSPTAVAYVSLQGTDALIAIDVQTGAVLWKTKVGTTPAGVMWLNGTLLVGIMGADYVAVVDPANGAVERRVQTGKGAHNLFLSPDGRTLYVCNRVDGSISLLDPKTLAVRGRIAMPGGPDDMDFAPTARSGSPGAGRTPWPCSTRRPASSPPSRPAARRTASGSTPTRPTPDTRQRTVIDPFDTLAGLAAGALLIPLLYQFDMMEWEDVGYGWALFALYGVAQVLITLAICLPLERWRPVEHWPDAKAVTWTCSTPCSTASACCRW